jgi:hypothetical protein
MAGVATSAVMAAVAASKIFLAVIIGPLANDLILTNIAGTACSSGDILATPPNGRQIIANDALTSCSFGRGFQPKQGHHKIFSVWTRAGTSKNNRYYRNGANLMRIAAGKSSSHDECCYN